MKDELYARKMKIALNKLSKDKIIELFIELNISIGNNLIKYTKAITNFKESDN